MTITREADSVAGGWDDVVLTELGECGAALRQRVREARRGRWDLAESLGLCDASLATRLARRAGVEVAAEPGAGMARELLSESVARRFGVAPLADVGGALEVAVSDPFDFDCERALGFATGRALRFRLASPATIRRWQDAVYRDAPDALQRIVDGLGATHEVHAWAEEAEDLADSALLARRADEQPVIRLADHILAEGIAQRASDIHVEAEEGGYAVRYRIDGVLRHALAVPRGAGVPLVSRLKIVAGMDIADRLRPQDGRARVSVDGARVDLRVSTLPAALGEKVVIRVLDARGGVRPLGGLGFTESECGRFVRLLEARDGLILVTGPTGSGKTTTLYSALTAVRERGVNVVTVEDPVEYRIAGVSQVQVNERAGLTFATALRAILRQDPDVVFVGEIRDAETASIAVQAALTGHLVFSTLHTVDAAGAVARLVDVGVEPYKVAAALRGVVAQRLVRRLCAACGGRPAGGAPCDACGGGGYRGRVAVTEVLRCTPAVAAAIGRGAGAVAREAAGDGMRAMWWSGAAHVAAGATTLDELRRVCEPPASVPLDGSVPLSRRRVAEDLPSDGVWPVPSSAHASRAAPHALAVAARGRATRPARRRARDAAPDAIRDAVHDDLRFAGPSG